MTGFMKCPHVRASFTRLSSFHVLVLTDVAAHVRNCHLHVL
jgi:hypothetical protein